jgi:hypothetical protein
MNQMEIKHIVDSVALVLNLISTTLQTIQFEYFNLSCFVTSISSIKQCVVNSISFIWEFNTIAASEWHFNLICLLISVIDYCVVGRYLQW